MLSIKYPEFLEHPTFCKMLDKYGLSTLTEFIHFYSVFVRDCERLGDDMEALEFVVCGDDVGYLRTSNKTERELFMGENRFKGIVDHDCLGVIATLYALSYASMNAYENCWNFDSLDAARSKLRQYVDLREDSSTIWRAID